MEITMAVARVIIQKYNPRLITNESTGKERSNKRWPKS